MSMFCFQCQETAKGTGCTIGGVCGKKEVTAKNQDLLIEMVRSVSIMANAADKSKVNLEKADKYAFEALFMTITNANYDDVKIIDKAKEGIEIKKALISNFKSAGLEIPAKMSNYEQYDNATDEQLIAMNDKVSVLRETNEDIRSLKELLIYGTKGIAAYAEHAFNLGYVNKEIFVFMHKAMNATTEDLDVNTLVGLVLECGKFGVDTMALLDQANTESYGNPEISEVNIGVRNKPAILISGHDLKDMEELLAQTEGTGVDVYTHSEMLPANYYPKFKKYEHFVGNYGNAWWKQKEEFASFNGPILFTTNCIVPPKGEVVNRIFTTGSSGFPGCKHIANREEGKQKDFSEIIELAKKLDSPTEIETGKIVGGFAHNQVIQLADKVVAAVKSGAIRKFVVMAGCDGRMKSRDYYTQFAKKLPQDTVILTAGCAKYRYNKLELGDIGGIPRVLDAGQCNDSYSLVVIALKLKEVFELNDVNDLPIAYNIAWYEQKAVIVLLALLSLGIKNIHLGPSLPAFLSPNVINVLVENFNISGITEVDADIKAMIG